MTDGITVTPAEIEQEFRRRNEKVKIDYVVIKPEDLQAKIKPATPIWPPTSRRTRRATPCRSGAWCATRCWICDQLRARATVSDDDIQHLLQRASRQYKLPDRAHVAHILFKTVGKTDAEVEEIRKKAEDVLKKAKSGANFADLAKQYSEDTTKDKGGDLDWIVRGQTVPEFEQAAFSLPKGSISDLVKTQYGFHIIKVIDRRERPHPDPRRGAPARSWRPCSRRRPSSAGRADLRPDRRRDSRAPGGFRSTTWPRSST